MPESYEECREFRSEAERLRTAWIRRDPDQGAYSKLRHDWMRKSGGFWDRVRHEPDLESAVIRSAEGDYLERGREEAKKRRAAIMAAGWTFERTNLADVYATPDVPIPGVSLARIEPWRSPAAMSFRIGLARGSDALDAYFEWTSPYLDLSEVFRSIPSWNSFWLNEVEAVRMPRMWLRWAFETLSGLVSVSDGTLCDVQLGTYLPSADHFVTADRVLVRIIDKCRRESPVQIAEPQLLPGGHNCAPAELFAMLAEIGKT
jgi:hypothetical protein